MISVRLAGMVGRVGRSDMLHIPENVREELNYDPLTGVFSWERLVGEEAEPDMYCDNDTCEVI